MPPKCQVQKWGRPAAKVQAQKRGRPVANAQAPGDAEDDVLVQLGVAIASPAKRNRLS